MTAIEQLIGAAEKVIENGHQDITGSIFSGFRHAESWTVENNDINELHAALKRVNIGTPQ